MPETDFGSPPVKTFAGFTTIEVFTLSSFSSLSSQAIKPRHKLMLTMIGVILLKKNMVIK